MKINVQKKIEIINECNCIVDLNELEAAMLWYSDKPIASLKKIFMHGKYPAIAIYKDKIHVHRLLVQFWNNRRLSTLEYVHHVNENKLDASKSNLQILPCATHQSISNKGRKQSAEHVFKRINSTTLTRYGHSIQP
jgi:hypothetical protein